MTAATPTGPASGPRPTSSTPATHRWPLANASRSKSKCGVVTTGRGGGAAFFFTVLHAARHESRLSLGRKLSQLRRARQGGIWKCRWKETRARPARSGSAILDAWIPLTLSWNAFHPLSLPSPGRRCRLGGSRATGAAMHLRTTDIGLYFSEQAGLDVERLRGVVKGLVDEPDRCAGHRSRRLGAVDRRAAAGSRSAARKWTCSIGRSNRSRRSFATAARAASAWTISRASAWLLLGDLDGRSRALPAAKRS